MKLTTPHTSEEFDATLAEAERLLLSLDRESTEWEDIITQLAIFAGSFNHVITRAHRDRIHAVLASIGEDAIGPVLEALFHVHRTEQIDLTKRFIKDLIRKEQNR